MARPRPSFTRPNSTMPAMYSRSRIGVTMKLRRLRDHVSSMNPVETAMLDW